MKLTEKAMTYLEERIPELAGNASNQAFLETLAAGETVLIAEDGNIIEVFPDGTRKVIRKIDPPQIINQRSYTILKV